MEHPKSSNHEMPAPIPRDQERNGSKRDLWNEAYEKLRDSNQSLVKQYEILLKDKAGWTPENGAQPDDMLFHFIEQRGKDIEDRKWKIRNNSVRGGVERAAGVLRAFQKIGNFAAEVDPVHVALPWAGVSLVLSVSLSNAYVFTSVQRKMLINC